MRCLLLLISLLAITYAERRFPAGFKFGAATSSYQIEGAWNVSDKSPSIWDTFTHDHPDYITDRSNGDVACDSYNLWETDVALAKEIGLHFYRFSIAWPRLLPTGFSNVVSEDGSRYYNNLIDGLLANGIEPVVTLYHWDLPQSLQDLGGWANPDITTWFEDYARVAYTLFGDRVKTWVTVNEPIVFCDAVYSNGRSAPGIASPGIANYLCAKNVMVAHAKAYRVYDTEFKHKFNGKVGLTNHHVWYEANTPEDEENAEFVRNLAVRKVGLTNHHVWYEANTPEDEENAEFVRNLAAIYAHPILSKDGGWPPSVEQFIAKLSREEGYPRSRLPAFTSEEIDLVKGAADFYGINYYTSRVVATGIPSGETVSWFSSGYPEKDLIFKVDPNWKDGASWIANYPPGLRKQMKWLKDQYGDIEIQILENGYLTPDPIMYDIARVEYYEDHLEQVLLSIKEDGVNVTAFTAWSLLDNYEWGSGYTVRFGLVNVDFSDPLRARTPRASALYYAAVIHNHSLDLKDY